VGRDSRRATPIFNPILPEINAIQPYSTLFNPQYFFGFRLSAGHAAGSKLDFRGRAKKYRGNRMPEKSAVAKKLTRDEQRELDIKISFMEGVVKRDPGYVEALQVLGDDYTRRGRYVAGLKVDEQLSQLRPDDPLVQYNLACSYSLTGNFNQAVAALDKALDLGYRDFKWLSQDPDLNDLRLHPLYKNIRAKLRQLRAARR